MSQKPLELPSGIDARLALLEENIVKYLKAVQEQVLSLVGRLDKLEIRIDNLVHNVADALEAANEAADLAAELRIEVHELELKLTEAVAARPPEPQEPPEDGKEGNAVWEAVHDVKWRRAKNGRKFIFLDEAPERLKEYLRKHGELKGRRVLLKLESWGDKEVVVRRRVAE